jgi:putative transposase
MKPEQLEIARLKREVIKLKAERDILTRPTSRRNRREVLLHCEAPGDLAGGLVMRGARCLAEGLSRGLHRIERLMQLQALKARSRRRRLPPDFG